MKMANPSESQLSNGGGQQSSSNTNLLSTIGGLVGAISNPIASIWNYFANKSLAEDQRRFAIEQWNRENAYNHPVNQVNRLLSAGLNPALMYQNGANGLVSASSPDIRMAAPANLQGLDPLSLAQVENLQAQTESIKHSTQREDEKQPLNLDTLRANIKTMQQGIKESISRVSLNQSQEFLNNALEGKAKEDAKKSLYEWKFLCDSMDDRLQDIKNVAELHGLESKKLSTELEYLGDTLKQALDNMRNTYALLTSQRAYYYAAAYNQREQGKQQGKLANARVNEVDYYRQGLNNEATRINNEWDMFRADLNYRWNALKAQVERWDSMTTNERLGMLENLLSSAMQCGSRIYGAKTIAGQ